MRLKSKMIVDMELKRAQSMGLFANIQATGDIDAGQIYIILHNFEDQYLLIGPNVGNGFDENYVKNWQMLLDKSPMPFEQVNDYLQKIKRFDPDIYILEIEDKTLSFRPEGNMVDEMKDMGALSWQELAKMADKADNE